MVEILVSLTIGLMLMLIVGGIYISSQQTMQFTNDFNHIQEGARAVLDDMSRDIRSAGFLGCFSARAVDRAAPGVTPVVRKAAPTIASGKYPLSPNYLDPEAVLGGGQANSLTLPSAGLQPLPGTDYIQVQSGSAIAYVAPGDTDSGNAPTRINRPIKLHTGEPFALASCRKAIVVRATNGSDSGRDSNILEHSPGAMNRGTPPEFQEKTDIVAGGAAVIKLSSVVYFVGKDRGSDTANLYRWEGLSSRNPEPFLSNVEDMKIIYGVDAGNTGNVTDWKTASAVTAANQWGNVVVVSVNILARSEKKVSGHKPARYVWNAGRRAFEKTGIAADQYFRKPYSMSATLRSRTNT